MVDPENADHHKTKGVSNDVGKQVVQIMPKRPCRPLPGDIGNFYGQYHNCYNDRDNPIAESFYPGRTDFHSKIFRTQQYKYQANQNSATLVWIFLNFAKTFYYA